MTQGLLFETPETRMRWLEDEIRRHDRLYYVQAKPEISDREYDAFFDELVALEALHPELVSPDSPTQRVGSDLAHDLPEVAHTIPVLSLDKCYSPEELLAWLTKTVAAASGGDPLSFVLEEKLDGASIVLTYEASRLVRAVTRGNGAVGNDVTANARTIRSIPLVLTEAASLTVRGEVFMRRAAFEAYNTASGEHTPIRAIWRRGPCAMCARGSRPPSRWTFLLTRDSLPTGGVRPTAGSWAGL